MLQQRDSNPSDDSVHNVGSGGESSEHSGSLPCALEHCSEHVICVDFAVHVLAAAL